jgi:hypothetical protein
VLRIGLLLVGLVAAVVLRGAVGGAGVARSRPAALVFALALAVLVVAGSSAWQRYVTRRGRPPWAGPLIGVLVGVVGAAVLCLPAASTRLADTAPLGAGPRVGFLGWAAVVAVVATAEEIFLRGTLFRLLERFGLVLAIGVPALAFAALHVPLYGWDAAPLDLAVGVWLGALRAVTGTWAAPATAHVLADWAAWALT